MVEKEYGNKRIHFCVKGEKRRSPLGRLFSCLHKKMRSLKSMRDLKQAV